MRGGVSRSSRFGLKGGVTLYIIIGLIILIVGSVGTYIVTQQLQDITEKERRFIQTLPTEIQGPVFLAQNCLRSTTKEGIELIGQQGGYAELSTELSFSRLATESDGVILTDSEDSPRIPYWYYMSSRSDCVQCSFKGNSPNLNDMEAALSSYVEENLEECVDNFNALQEQYEITILGSPEVKVDVNEIVSVKLNYPIKIKTEESELAHQEFEVTLPVNLKKMHELATTISNHEIETGFLERKMLSEIAASSGIDTQLPPTAGTQLGYEQSFWIKEEVKSLLQDVVRDNVMLFTLPATRNFFPVDTGGDLGEDIEQGYYFSYVIPALDPSKKDYLSTDVSFFYFDWPLYLDINPSEGQLIRPEEATGDSFGFLPITSQSYSFAYDLAFPVVIELRDVTAFNGEGFSFMFALEANVRNNEAFQDKDYRVAFLESGETSLFSSPKQRISGDVEVLALDEEDNPLSEVDVRYTCGEEGVSIGTTDISGTVVAKYPICEGGIVKLFKDGYLNSNIPLTTDIGKSGSVSGNLLKIFEKEVELRVRHPEVLERVDSVATGLTVAEYTRIINEEHKPLEYEEAFITLTRVKDNPWDPSFVRTLYFADDEVQNVQIAPGKYSLSGTYLYYGENDEGVEIPATRKKVRYPNPDTFGATKKTKWIPIPAIPLVPAPLGGALLDETTGYWQVTNDDLANRNKFNLFVIKQKDPETHEELGNLADPLELSQKYPSLVKPRWE
jgi:hypothetical protein